MLHKSNTKALFTVTIMACFDTTCASKEFILIPSNAFVLSNDEKAQV